MTCVNIYVNYNLMSIKKIRCKNTAVREKEITIRLVREKDEIIIIRQAYLIKFQLKK